MGLPVYLSRKHLRNCRQSMMVITTACYVYSGSWLAIEILSHFHSTFEDWSRGNFRLLIIIFSLGLMIGTARYLRKCAKMLSVTHRLEGQDISIEIRIGDIFSIEGAFIISTNTAFDTDMLDGPVSPESLQGQFTKKYYDKVGYLEQELTDTLIAEEFVLDGEEPERKENYDIGKVIKVSPRGQVAYFVAIDKLREYGGIESSLDNVREGLGSLWYYIGIQGVLDPLVIPVLGTGYSGIPISREQMIIEIITSFIAACTEKKFCEKLTIIISEDDYRQHNVNLEELGTYLRLYAREVHRKAHDLVAPVDEPI